MCGGGIIRGDNVNVQQSNNVPLFLLFLTLNRLLFTYSVLLHLFFAVVEPFSLTVAAANLPFHCSTWQIKSSICWCTTRSENSATLTTDGRRSAGILHSPHPKPWPLQTGTPWDSLWPGRGSPAETLKVVVIHMQRVLDQWSGWHIHWQARYYSSATVPQIVFQAFEAFMSLVRVGPSVCHRRRGSLPAEPEEWGHAHLDVLACEECEAKRCHTKLELTVRSLLF